MTPDTIQISIPFDLARYVTGARKLVRKYETNQLIKALDTWLILKAETSSGYIQQWNRQKDYLLKICKVSESIFRHRLNILADLKILQYNRHGITVASWEKFGASLNIETDNRLTVNYCIHDKSKVQQWIIATEIEDNKQRQEYALLLKLNKNLECKTEIRETLIKSGADRTRLNSDTAYFIAMMKAFYLSDFVSKSEIHNVLIHFRPDNNRSVYGMAKAWNCKHPQTVSYWKKKLKQSNIIDIQKLSIESLSRTRNKMCRVLWLEKDKATLLRLCDQIDILKPWTVNAEILPAA